MVDDSVRFDIRARDRSGAAFASANRGAVGLARNLRNLGRAGGAALAAVGGTAVVRQINATVQAVAALGDTADRVNVSAEALQAYRFALEENGGEARQMDDSLQRLNRRLGLAADGAGPAVSAFRQLGVEVRDANGQVREVDPVFREVVQRLSEVGTAAETAALASAFFGEDSGPKLVPLLNQGIAGLERYEQQARELGIVLEEDLVDSAQVTAREFQRIIDQMTVKFQELVVGGVNAAKALGEAFSPDERGSGVQALRDQLEQTTNLVGSMEAALQRIEEGPAEGRRPERIRQIENTLFRARMEASGLADLIRSLERAPAATETTGDTGGAGGAGLTTQAQGVLDNLRFQAEQLARNAEQQRIYNELRAAGVELDSAAGQEIAALVGQLQAATDAETAATEAAREAAAHQREVEALYRATRTPLELYNAELERLNGLLRENVIDEDLHGRAVEMAGERLAQQTEKARELGDVFSGPLDQAIRGNIRSFEDLGRVALSVLSDIISQTIRAQAAMGGGGGGAGGGFDFGTIFTAVAGFFGFQHGGRFTVGGSGGPDSQFVPLMLSPREEVEIRTPAQARAAAANDNRGTIIIENNIDARGADPASAARIEGAVDRIRDATLAAVIETSNQGGAMAFATGRRRRR